MFFNNTHICTGEGRATFTATVYVSRQTRAAGAFIHLPVFIGVKHCPLVQTRHLRVYNTYAQQSLIFVKNTPHPSVTSFQCRIPRGEKPAAVFILWYLDIHSSISQEVSLAFVLPDKWQVNTLQCCTQCSPTEDATTNRLLKKIISVNKKRSILEMLFFLNITLVATCWCAFHLSLWPFCVELACSLRGFSLHSLVFSHSPKTRMGLG